MTVNKPQTTSLIDTISEGYAAINRRPWLVLLPLLLNLYIWYGTQLSFAPLLTDPPAMTRLGASSAEQSAAAEQVRRIGGLDMRQPIAWLNFIPTLTMYAIRSTEVDCLPTVVPLVCAVPPPLAPERDTIKVYDLGGLILAVLLLNLLALPLSAIFLTQLAAAVRSDRVSLPTSAQRAWRAMLALLGKLGVLLGVGLALGLPFVFLSGMLMLFSPPLGWFMLGVIGILLFWVSIYLGFANEAIVVSGVGPLRALHASFNIVRRNFWGTLGFLALSWLISAGSGVLWLNLSQGSTVGLLVAITGSAYLGSGLLAARMAFYRERLRRWQSAAAVRTS
ncbi:MAG TPA: hypothetical protein VFO07_07815 [Roseiflexaceae bacterium]|nr:hypothetical protein [Roseiflexaceae bacterium]